MSERELTDEEINAMFEKFAGLMRDMTELLEKMVANMDLVISSLRTLASLQQAKEEGHEGSEEAG